VLKSRASSMHVSTAVPIAPSAPGKRADTSVTPPAGHEESAMTHGYTGGLFR
jgi:hypothetical protein